MRTVWNHHLTHVDRDRVGKRRAVDGEHGRLAIGDRLPDFSLPDAFGRVVNFHEHRGGSKAALVFYRSAVW